MKNILQKLHSIMSEVDFIAKDKTNEFHKYKYASEQAIKETLHPILLKHKVLFTLSASNIRHVGSLTDIDFVYKFIDIESCEILEGTFTGTGEDKLDKGTYKAITGAIKYILTSTFLIPTGDDPENEDKSKKTPKATPNYSGTQYENRKPSTAKPKTEFEEGDTLKTGVSKASGKEWFAIDKPNRERIFITAQQYEFLSGAGKADETFSAPLPEYQGQ